MTNKIDMQNTGGVDITRSRARAADATQRDQAPDAGKRTDAARDDVRLTSTATNLKRIETSLAAIPEIDQSRVDEIRQRLQADSYQINPQQLAQKMLRLDQGLG